MCDDVDLARNILGVLGTRKPTQGIPIDIALAEFLYLPLFWSDRRGEPEAAKQSKRHSIDLHRKIRTTLLNLSEKREKYQDGVEPKSETLA